jgi:V/A-type H+-transporting ATPase subunit B
MPNDDITHPIPDVTGYITEGQLVLSRELYNRGIYPPVDVLPSLSRLMEDGIGEGRTRADHSKLASQLYAAYAKVKEIERLASIIGTEELSELHRRYLKFGERFEHEFLSQPEFDNRSFEATLETGWKVLEPLPDSELTRLTQQQIESHRAQPPHPSEDASPATGGGDAAA